MLLIHALGFLTFFAIGHDGVHEKAVSWFVAQFLDTGNIPVVPGGFHGLEVGVWVLLLPLFDILAKLSELVATFGRSVHMKCSFVCCKLLKIL
jgi:hypothetical protein